MHWQHSMRVAFISNILVILLDALMYKAKQKRATFFGDFSNLRLSLMDLDHDDNAQAWRHNAAVDPVLLHDWSPH